MSDKPDIDPEMVRRATEWSDFNIVIPLLFNFYHGCELILKGFVMCRQGHKIKSRHRLSVLRSQFAELYPDERELHGLFAKYLDGKRMPPILSIFFESNGVDIDRFYDCLKYPYDQNLSQEFSHYCLAYKGSRGVAFYRGLHRDIEAMSDRLVALGKEELKRLGPSLTG